MALPPTAPGQRMPSQESLLLDYLHRLETHRNDRRAIHIHLSRLKPENRREHHIRIAATSFDPMIKSTTGQLFVLRNNDLFFIYKIQAQNDVETSMLRLQFLFGDDPLMNDEETAQSHLSSTYDVETEFNDILALARNMVHEDVVDDANAAEPLDAKSELELRREMGEPLTPRVLGRVELALQRADISNMMRRQFICGLIGEASPQPLFSELFISISDLRETLLPGVNLASSRWLFQHLTETLDRRVLAFLGRTNDRSITGEISINLNVSTLLSPEFMQFDDSVIAAMRGSLVLELQQVDIFGDLNAYIFARGFAKDHGYRICIDGLTAKTMPFIDRERLGADMVKLVWDSELLDDNKREEVSAMVQRAGSTRVILCRCDDAAAVNWGQSIGINMFQGRHIENLLAADSRRRDIEAARRQPLSGEFIE